MDTRLVNFSIASGCKGIFSDFDGTLSRIKSNPAEVKVHPKSKENLNLLKKNYTVGIISGRPAGELMELVGIKGIYYVGNHGAEIMHNGDYFVFPRARKETPAINEIYKDLKRQLSSQFDLHIKNYSASIHYRRHPEPEEAQNEIFQLIKKYEIFENVKFNLGRFVVEVRIKGINKATALRKIIKENYINDFIYFGDDVTDLDIFKMVEPHLNIFVSNPETSYELAGVADIIIKNPDEVSKILFEINTNLL